MTNTITLKGIIDEDFVNYKIPSMTLMFPKCTFKCGNDLCQNAAIINEEDITVAIDDICNRYIHNPITSAIVCQGLEPLDSFDQLVSLVDTLRNKYNCDDDIVIYSGYDEDEVLTYIDELSQYKNIIVKFGRYIPGQPQHYDSVLGVSLASENQFAKPLHNSNKECYT